MVSQVLVGSRACTGQREMKDTEALREHLVLLDYRSELLSIPKTASFSVGSSRIHIYTSLYRGLHFDDHIFICRECRDYQGRRERAGMLAPWWVLFCRLITYITLFSSVLLRSRSQVCSRHHFTDIFYLASGLLWLWLVLFLSDIGNRLDFPLLSKNLFEYV